MLAFKLNLFGSFQCCFQVYMAVWKSLQRLQCNNTAAIILIKTETILIFFACLCSHAAVSQVTYYITVN